MRTFKLYMVRARVSKKMKQQLEALANERGEAEAVLIREAIRVYLESHPTVVASPEVLPSDVPVTPPVKGSSLLGLLGLLPAALHDLIAVQTQVF
jgi:hypothetical protein